jgi:peptide/nickel transport system permease protein
MSAATVDLGALGPGRERRQSWLLPAVRKNRWWITRILMLPVHMIVFAFVVFVLVRALPGDPVLTILGTQFTPALYARTKHALGLDGSFLTQLGHYYNNLIHFSLGNSIVGGLPVKAELATRLPATLELALQAMAAVVIFSFVASYIAVMRPASIAARLIRAYAKTAGAIPEFCVGLALLFVFYAELHWAPAPLGRIDPGLTQPPPITHFPLLDSILQGDWTVAISMIKHLVLPITVEVIAQSAVMVRLLISGLEESIEAAPTRFRIASGAPRRTVTLSMYRRALPATVTMMGTLFGYLLGGAVILESLFGFTGMGQYLVDAVNSKDFVSLQDSLLVVGALSLVVFLLVDLANMLLDPRRKPGARPEEALSACWWTPRSVPAPSQVRRNAADPAGTGG